MPVNRYPVLQHEYKRAERLMGNTFEITVLADDESRAMEKINLAIGEIRRIESLLTTFDPNSQANQVNQLAGIAPVKVDGEVFNLIQRSMKISAITDGAFDITYGSIDKKLWNFDKTMTSLPDEVTAKSMIRMATIQQLPAALVRGN